MYSRELTKLRMIEQQELTSSLSDDLIESEYTNACRRLAREFGEPACVEQQTHKEWLQAHERAEVFA